LQGLDAPEEIGLEFGFKFNSKAGAVIASVDSEAAFKVSIKGSRGDWLVAPPIPTGTPPERRQADVYVRPHVAMVPCLRPKAPLLWSWFWHILDSTKPIYRLL